MHQTSTLDKGATASGRGLVGTLASLAIAAAVVASIGLWQARHREATQPAPAAAAPTAPDAGTAASAGVPAPWYEREGDGPTWYLVGSRGQAEQATEVLSYRNKALLLEGSPLQDTQVIVVDSPLAEQQIRFASGDERATRAANGAPTLRLVDLRAEGDRPACGLDALASAC